MIHYPNTRAVDVAAYHDNIQAALAALFPEMKTLGCYERIEGLPATPALIFGLTEITPEADTGTEQVAVAFHFSNRARVSAFPWIRRASKARFRKRFLSAGKMPAAGTTRARFPACA